MFEDTIESAKRALLDKINLSDKFVYLHEIISHPDIEQGYKDYFLAEVKWWIYERQIERESCKNFDLKDPEIITTYSHLDELYMKNGRFNKESLNNIVNAAVKVRTNMACRPRNTLNWFIFRFEKTKPFIEILKRLEYFSDHEYLCKAFIKYIESNSIIENSHDILRVNEFEKIIEKIDNEFIFELSPEEFAALLDPIFILFNRGKELADSLEIPVEAALIFLDDKGITPLYRKCAQMAEEKNMARISKARFLDFLYKEIDHIDNVGIEGGTVDYQDAADIDDIPENAISKDVPTADAEVEDIDNIVEDKALIDEPIDDILAEETITDSEDILAGQETEPDTDQEIQENNETLTEDADIQMDDGLLDELSVSPVSAEDIVDIPTPTGETGEEEIDIIETLVNEEAEAKQSSKADIPAEDLLTPGSTTVGTEEELSDIDLAGMKEDFVTDPGVDENSAEDEDFDDLLNDILNQEGSEDDPIFDTSSNSNSFVDDYSSNLISQFEKLQDSLSGSGGEKKDEIINILQQLIDDQRVSSESKEPDNETNTAEENLVDIIENDNGKDNDFINMEFGLND